MMSRLPYLAVIFLAIFANYQTTRASPNHSVDVNDLEQAWDITDFAQVILDKNNLAVEGIVTLFPYQGVAVQKLLNGGYRTGFYWVKLNFANSSDEEKFISLIIKNRVTSFLEHYIVQNNTNKEPEISRLPARIPNLILSIAPHQEFTLLLKLKFGLHDELRLIIEQAEPDAEKKPDYLLQSINIFNGIIIAMCLFNVFLFLLTKDSTFILHAISATLITGAISFLSGLCFYLFENDHWNDLAPAFGNYAVASVYLFAQSYLKTKDSHPILHKFFTAGATIGITGGSLLLLGVSKQLVYFTDLNLIFIAILGLSTLYFFPPRKYRMMRFYLIGWFGLAISALVWIAMEYGYIERNFFSENALYIGLSFEMLVISLGLADQINHYKNQLQAYSKNLEYLVEEKTRDIRSIMKHIPLGIFMIKPDLKIHKDHSHYIKEIFDHSDLESQDAMELIFSASNLSSDAKNQAINAIQSALGEELINFEVNCHALPLEIHRQDKSGETKIFDLTWNCILDTSEKVDKILVTMRDVTDWRKLQEQAKDQQEELEFIGEILRVPSSRFLRFIRTCHDLIQENKKLIHSQEKNFEILKLLFINMHTIKGAARSLYLKKMTSVFHDVEQYYAHLQKNMSATWDVAKMEKDLDQAQRIVLFYENIAKEKLGRSCEQAQFVEFHIEHIESAYRDLSRASRGKSLAPDLAAGIEQVKILFSQKIFKSAKEVLQELCGSLPVLARDLQKAPPETRIQAEGLLIGEQAEELLRNIFVHIFRNGMDHGIETPAERIKKGKAPHGLINIEMKAVGDKMLICYSDDGRGINIAKIREIALAKDLITIDEARNLEKVASLIFDSGLSTARQVTDISGRGVGMNAVKRFVLQNHGTVEIRLDSNSDISQEYYKFSLEITLPLELFAEQDTISEREVA